MLKINEVRMKVINKGKFLGYASILIEGIIIDGIELYEGKKGRYIYMPLNGKVSKISKTKRNSAYPINNETREKILKVISDKYDEEVNRQ